MIGPEVEAFEREFADFCGTKHCVAVSSGTAALHLGLLALGVQADHEVITSPNSFLATAEAITYCGAVPVFVDIDPANGNLDPRLIERAITPRTRVILPVHVYGRPADMDPIREIAARHNLRVSRMPRKPTALAIAESALADSPTRRLSASIQLRTSAHTAKAER